MQTFDRVIQGDTYDLHPLKKVAGLFINGIQVNARKIYHFQHRVDIKDEDKMAFIIEHPLSVPSLFGVHSCRIEGNATDWDFYRSTHREAFTRGLKPSSSLGPPTGAISDGIVGALQDVKVINTPEPLQIKTVATHAEHFVDDTNHISIDPLPLDQSPSLRISVKLFDLGPLKATLDPIKGLLDESGNPDIRFKVLTARSPAVIGPEKEALYHTLGDVISDIASTGDIRSGIVEVQLGFAYHRTTIGLVKKLLKRDEITNWDNGN